MKYSIVYSSRTGNTAQLADVLREALQPESCVYFGAPDRKALSAPMIFVGFWTDKGSCDEASKEFLKMLKNKTVFLFGTAGFGGNSEYFEKILNAAKENLDESNNVVGSFMSQGKMQVSVLERYEKMLLSAANSAQIQGMIENFHKAVTHPDQMDLDGLKIAVNNLKKEKH